MKHTYNFRNQIEHSRLDVHLKASWVCDEVIASFFNPAVIIIEIVLRYMYFLSGFIASFFELL